MASFSAVRVEAQTTRDESTTAEKEVELESVVETPEKVEVDPTADDEAIQARIERILNASSWFESISVDVEAGIVILAGKTEQAQYRDWAGNIARKVEAVVAVVNNIEVTDAVAFDLSETTSHVSHSLQSLWYDFLARLPLIIVGIVVLLVVAIVEKINVMIVRRSAAKARLRSSLQDLLAQLATFTTWLFGIMIAAVIVFPGMTPAKLLTVLGLSSVALGFAFKEIFENFFAGVLILWRFPFDKGDFVECQDICGKIEDVTIRMSLIRQVDGQLVVLPNAMLFKNSVKVLTSQDLRRTTVICGVAYGEDVDQSRDVIFEAVKSCPTVADEKPVEIFASEFASSSINFEVTWWTGAEPLEIRRSRDEVIAKVKRALDDAGIEIPFPYRTLTFNEPLPLSGEAFTPLEDAMAFETTNNGESDA